MIRNRGDEVFLLELCVGHRLANDGEAASADMSYAHFRSSNSKLMMILHGTRNSGWVLPSLAGM
eukprot:3368139-Amphidinium_carterae.1